MEDEYYWLHFKKCSHDKSWPCRVSDYPCGEHGWVIGIKDKTSILYPFSIAGSDQCFGEDDFSEIVKLEISHP